MSDFKLSAAGKLFFASLVAFLNGSKSAVKLKGTPEQIQAILDVIKASKEFEEITKKPGVSVEEVIEKMRAKNLAVVNFQVKTQRNWPL